MAAVKPVLYVPGHDFSDVGIDLPVIPVDDDFFEYLQELSAEHSLDITEFWEYWSAWEKENCE